MRGKRKGETEREKEQNIYNKFYNQSMVIAVVVAAERTQRKRLAFEQIKEKKKKKQNQIRVGEYTSIYTKLDMYIEA
jgi:hypothetical protein